MSNNQKKQTTENWIAYKSFRYNYRYTKTHAQKIAPVLFLCGAFQNSNSRRTFEDHFSSFADVIVVELPGNGKADTLPAEYGFDYYRQALLHLLTDIDVPKVYIIAASYGTPIAYDFAQHHPEKVDRMALVGTMRSIPEQLRDNFRISIESIQQGNLVEFTNLAIDTLSSKKLLEKSMRYSIGARVLKSQLMKYSDDEQKKYIENTKRLLQMKPLNLSAPPKVKTLVFTGEYDEFTKPEYCEEVARAIPDAQFTTIKDADHLFHLQQFKTTVELFERFGTDKDIYSVPGCTHYC